MVKAADKIPHVVIFVEGDTDKVFFESLIRYYQNASTTDVRSWEVCNMKGISRYLSKFLLKLRNELIPEAKRLNREIIAVCCSYDTDVFEQGVIPYLNWKTAANSVKKLGIKTFCEIRVNSAMEDWLLEDIAGLSRYLKLKQVPTSLKGKNGFEKMDSLFRKGNRRYVKGFQIDRFISELDLSLIRSKRKDALEKLEEVLNVTLE